MARKKVGLVAEETISRVYFSDVDQIIQKRIKEVTKKLKSYTDPYNTAPEWYLRGERRGLMSLRVALRREL